MPPFKTCTCCGQSFTRANWQTLKLIGHQVDEDEDLEMRDCLCGSTLAVVVEDFARDEAEERAAAAEYWRECMEDR